MPNLEDGAVPAPPALGPVQVRGYTNRDGQLWVEVTYNGKAAMIEYAQFAERSSVWPLLSKNGLVFVRRADRSDLFEQVENLVAFPPRLIFEQPGWSGGQFANASGRVFRPRGQQAGAIGFLPDPDKCSKSGTSRAWRREVAEPLAGHAIPCFIIMSVLAAPLLDLSGRSENIGFELAGAGGKGKSTTQRLAASVVGPAMEKSRSYATTFHMTPAGLEQSMRGHSDMPLIIDEANLFGSGESGAADKRKMRDFAFAMASGTTKGRYDSPRQEGYRFVFITSSNAPFSQLLDDSHLDVAHAATDRLHSLTVPAGDAGVFGPLPDGLKTYREFTLALESAMGRQYGTAMPKFLRALVNARNDDETELRNSIRRNIDEFKSEVGITDNDGSDVRVAEAFGLVYAAGCFAKDHRVLPRSWDCLEAAKHCYANFRSTVPIRQSLSERLQAVANRPETLRIDPSDLPTLSDAQVDQAGAFVRTVKGETLLLMTTAFGKKMFPDWRSLKDTPEFQSLKRANEGGRGRGLHCRIRANKRMDWFYAFRLN